MDTSTRLITVAHRCPTRAVGGVCRPWPAVYNPRVGVILEASVAYHLRPLGQERVNGILVGLPPTPPAGAGFTVGAVAGLQLRL